MKYLSLLLIVLCFIQTNSLLSQNSTSTKLPKKIKKQEIIVEQNLRSIQQNTSKTNQQNLSPSVTNEKQILAHSASSLKLKESDFEFKKRIYEKAFNLDMTDEEFSLKLSSNQSNVMTWEKVLEVLKNHEDHDLSTIRNMVNSMRTKLN